VVGRGNVTVGSRSGVGRALGLLTSALAFFKYIMRKMGHVKKWRGGVSLPECAVINKTA
jgi:hypothetical protein